MDPLEQVLELCDQEMWRLISVPIRHETALEETMTMVAIKPKPKAYWRALINHSSGKCFHTIFISKRPIINYHLFQNYLF